MKIYICINIFFIEKTIFGILWEFFQQPTLTLNPLISTLIVKHGQFPNMKIITAETLFFVDNWTLAWKWGWLNSWHRFFLEKLKEVYTEHVRSKIIPLQQPLTHAHWDRSPKNVWLKVNFCKKPTKKIFSPMAGKLNLNFGHWGSAGL